MAEHDWMIRTFTQSIPNPGWEVTVTHVPTGITRRESGKGAGSREAAKRLRAEIEEALRYFDVVTIEHE